MPLEQQVPRLPGKVVAVISDTSVSTKNNREDYEKQSVDVRDLQKMKYTTQLIKLNRRNNEVQVLLDCESEPNLISKD